MKLPFPLSLVPNVSYRKIRNSKKNKQALNELTELSNSVTDSKTGGFMYYNFFLNSDVIALAAPGICDPHLSQYNRCFQPLTDVLVTVN